MNGLRLEYTMKIKSGEGDKLWASIKNAQNFLGRDGLPVTTGFALDAAPGTRFFS